MDQICICGYHNPKLEVCIVNKWQCLATNVRFYRLFSNVYERTKGICISLQGKNNLSGNDNGFLFTLSGSSRNNLAIIEVSGTWEFRRDSDVIQLSYLSKKQVDDTERLYCTSSKVCTCAENKAILVFSGVTIGRIS